MNLILDLGNTRLKAILFSGNKLLRSVVLNECSAKEVFDFLGSDTPSAVVICASIHIPENFIYDLESFFKVLIINRNTRYPVRNAYETPDTLGYDRIAAAIGGWQLFKGSPVLTIVAGTCITYNISDAEGTFLGGAISPGLRMRSKAMNAFTEKLPLIEPEGEHPLTGTTTGASLRSGIVNGTVAEIEGMISNYASCYPGLKTVLGGGDATLLAEAMKNGIFARPDIVAEGLNTILEFHVKNDLL